jgi:hypothetical protein
VPKTIDQAKVKNSNVPTKIDQAEVENLIVMYKPSELLTIMSAPLLISMLNLGLKMILAKVEVTNRWKRFSRAMLMWNPRCILYLLMLMLNQSFADVDELLSGHSISRVFAGLLIELEYCCISNDNL